MVTLVDGSYKLDREFFTDRAELILSHLELDGDVTIKLSGEEESRTLNSQFRKIDKATDVLSFPINEEFPDSFYIGDILICYPVAALQAIEGGISLKRELFTLMCHGLLHLSGHDHEKDSGEMLTLQEELINKYFTE